MPEAKPTLTFLTPGGRELERILPRTNGPPQAGHFDHALFETLPAVDASTHINRWLGEHPGLDLAIAGLLEEESPRGAGPGRPPPDPSMADADPAGCG